jgi:hypothetical protein
MIQEEIMHEESNQTEIELENTTGAEETPVSEPEKKPIKDKEENFKNLRERTLKAERERDELLQAIQKLNQNSEEEEDFNINPDELAEGKHLLKITKKLKKLEQKLAEAETKNISSTTEIKIARDFPDFEKVASTENLKKLREQQPDLAEAILATKDPYKQHALAYKMCKDLGIYQENNYQQEKNRAQENHAKPRPISSISPQQGEGPLSKANAFANGLTDELKAQLLKEMNEARKNM